MKTIATLGVLSLLMPATVFAATYPEFFRSGHEQRVESMLARRAVRRVERLRDRHDLKKELPEPQPTHVIRLGKKIISRRFSARRVRNFTEGTVVHVHDGSTLVARLNDYGYLPLKEVRLLGVDAPEILHDECFAQQAKEALEYMTLDKEIMLEKDDRFLRDSYRRSLHYLRVGTRDVGGWMIVNGYAFHDDDVRHERFDEYERYERLAREEDHGLWSVRCDYDIDQDETLQRVPR